MTHADHPHPASRQLVVRVASRTHCGLVRGDNQDRLLAARLGQAADLLTGASETFVSLGPGEALLLGVCDGMGGAAGGAVASACAVETIETAARAAWRATPDARGEALLARGILEATREASRRIWREAQENRALLGMGTTATVAGLVGRRLVLAQVGDSRAYVWRSGRLTQVTRDQSLATLMVERGQLTREQARTFEFSNVILQAVGTSDTLDVDLTSVALCRGDVLLVCSDGLSGPVDDDAIAEVLASATDCSAACDALIALALSREGPDNVTCIVARVEGGALPERDSAPEPVKVALEPRPPEPDDTQPADALADTQPPAKAVDSQDVAPVPRRDGSEDSAPGRPRAPLLTLATIAAVVLGVATLPLLGRC